LRRATQAGLDGDVIGDQSGQGAGDQRANQRAKQCQHVDVIRVEQAELEARP